MEYVIISGPSNDDTQKHMFLVGCEGYSPEENMWETFENVDENAIPLLEEYYVENANMEKDNRFRKEKSKKTKMHKCKKAYVFTVL